MREIKFRAWDITLKKMMYGIESYYDNLGEKYYPSGVNAVFGDFLNNKEQVVMQFTGILDKKGNKIWEGDLILAPNFGFDPSEGDDPNKILQVSFDKGSFTIGQDFASEFAQSEIEVFGNIYEHQELLK